MMNVGYQRNKIYINECSHAIYSNVEDIRIKLKRFLAISTIGAIYGYALLVFSIWSSCQYIAMTYIGDDELMFAAVSIIEKVFAVSFTFDWMLSFFLADYKLLHITSFFSMVDILTVIPIWVTSNRTFPVFSLITSVEETFIYILFILNVTQILRALRIRRQILLIEDSVQRCITEFCLIVVILILFNAGVMQALEDEVQPFAFHTWMYYICVTITTVGYGDIAPKSELGRVFAMFMIAFAIISVPKMTSEIIEKINLQSIYVRSVYQPRGFRSKHVILCGNLSSTLLSDFFHQLFHSDHDDFHLDAVILSSNSPSVELVLLLTSPRLQFNVFYLQGSPLSDFDLKRAKADRADAIFFMTNKFSPHADIEDSKIILQYLSFKRFIYRTNNIRLNSNNSSSSINTFNFSFSTLNGNTAIPNNSNINSGGFNKQLFCLQLIRPENKRNAKGTLNTVNTQDYVLCLNEIKMEIISKAVLFPGAITLLMNLITSYGGSSDESSNSRSSDQAEELRNRPLEFDAPLTLKAKKSARKAAATVVHVEEWFKEYEMGCRWEVYHADLTESFNGHKFIEISRMMYSQFSCLLFGMQLQERNKRFPARLLLNPSDLVIPSAKDYKMEVYIIATTRLQAEVAVASLSLALEGSRKKKPSSLGLYTSTRHLFSSSSISSSTKSAKSNSNDLIDNIDSDKSDTFRTAKQQVITRRSKRASIIQDSKKETYDIQEIKRLERQHLFDNYHVAISFTDNNDKNNSKSNIDNTISNSNSNNSFRNNKTNKVKFRSNRSLFSSPSMLSCTIKDYNDLVENNQDKSTAHIIVMGGPIELSSIFNLIKPLRAKSLEIVRPIVILTQTELPNSIWTKIAIFANVYLVNGSSLEEEDICRAGIFTAHSVIILSDIHNSHLNSEESTNNDGRNNGSVEANLLVDSNAIFTYKCVKSLVPNANIIVEIIQQTNVEYLDLEADISRGGTECGSSSSFLSPSYASGSLYITSMLDTLLLQSYYMPQIIKVFSKLISNCENFDREDLMKEPRGPGDEDILSDVKSSFLYQIDILNNTCDTYGELWDDLAKQGILCLGLFRNRWRLNDSRESSPVSYVFTNPDAATPLQFDDKVFVLSSRASNNLRNTFEVTSPIKSRNYNRMSTQMRNKDHVDNNEVGNQHKAAESANSNSNISAVSIPLDSVAFSLFDSVSPIENERNVISQLERAISREDTSPSTSYTSTCTNTNSNVHGYQELHVFPESTIDCTSVSASGSTSPMTSRDDDTLLPQLRRKKSLMASLFESYTEDVDGC